MKSLLTGMLLFLPFIGYGNTSDDIVSLVQNYSIGGTPMYEQVQLQDFLKDLKKGFCSPESIKQGQGQFFIAKKKLERSYQKLQDHKKLSMTKKTFATSQQWFNELTKPLGNTCAQAVFHANFMDYVRDLHIAILESSGIMKDFGSLSIPELYGSKIKIALLQDEVDALKEYENILPISFALSKSEIIAKEQGDKKIIIDLLTTLMKRTILKSLSDLKKQNLLSDSDLQQFQNKISLEYINSCSNFHGSYKMKEVYTSERVLVSQQVDQMKILVNICYNYHILQDIGTLFEKIVLHELGHHMYYQKDSQHAVFESLCWSNSKTKKKECDRQAFVSDYASTNSLEDYAEQFMFSYLRLTPLTHKKLQEKHDYFSEQFPVLKQKK